MILFLLSSLYASELCSSKKFTSKLSWKEIQSFTVQECPDGQASDLGKIGRRFKKSFEESLSKAESSMEIIELGSVQQAFFDKRSIIYHFSPSIKASLQEAYQNKLITTQKIETATTDTKTKSQSSLRKKLTIGIFGLGTFSILSIVGILGLLTRLDKKKQDDIDQMNLAAKEGAELLAKSIELSQQTSSQSTENSEANEELKLENNRLNREIATQTKLTQEARKTGDFYKGQFEQKDKECKELETKKERLQDELNRLQKEMEQIDFTNPATQERQDFDAFEVTGPVITPAQKEQILQLICGLCYDVNSDSQNLKILNKHASSYLSKIQNEDKADEISNQDLNQLYVYFLLNVWKVDIPFFFEHKDTIAQIAKLYKNYNLVDSDPIAAYDGLITHTEDGFHLNRHSLETGITTLREGPISNYTKIQFNSVYYKVTADEIPSGDPSSHWRISLKS